MTQREPEGLARRLATGQILVAPGVYDALTAFLAQAAGFEALYLSGAGLAYTRLGRPDIGLVSLSEVAATLALICERVETPVIVDADTGFGNALNVQRTVAVLERAGAAAIQIEDQIFPKRCGHLAGKQVVPAAEMAGKIRAAVDARHHASTLIIARTDALAIEGFEAAIARATRYREAGADILFVEAPRSLEQLRALTTALAGSAPLMANMVEGGQTPVLSSAQLAELGFSLVIFPGAIVRAVARQARDFYAALRRDGTTDAFVDRMLDFAGINALVGTDAMLARASLYAEDAP